MKSYYTYVYYDADWVAYYVGKGQKLRRHYRQDRIPVADKKHTQVFKFATEWEAFECERELISFWGRQLSGGLLMNICSGGAGAPGRPYNKAAHEKTAVAKRGKPMPAECVRQLIERNSIPLSLENINTGEILSFSSATEASRQLNISASSARYLRTGYFKTCKGWKLND